MYAYVRFIDDNEFDIINTKFIQKFDLNDIKYDTRKYQIKWKDGNLYPGVIIYIDETIEGLETKIDKRRVKLKPIELCESQTEDEGVPLLSFKSKKKENHKAEKAIFEKSYDKESTVQRGQQSSSETNGLLIEKLKLEIAKLKSENEEIKKINIKLQEIVIAKFEKLESLSITACSAQEIEPDEVPVGKIKPGTEDVHIGQNIFIHKNQWFDCFNQKNGSMFVRMLATAVFGVQTLKNSSVTGRQSNRTKVDAKPPLDSTRLAAIFDAYKYYLIKKGTDEVLVNAELQKATQYITSKINDLNRVPRVPKSKADSGKVKSAEVDKQKDDTEETEEALLEENKN